MAKANTPAHMAHATKMTRDGVRDYTNRKPYRTKQQKEQARRGAVKSSEDGAFHSYAPRSYHFDRRRID